tara:strand:+ start:129 stop:2087 length:1959 start_codon:yes stop_codon:yes gene_type:complete
MCGIIGQINYLKLNNIDIFTNIKKTINSLRHRGPDDNGIWINDHKNVCFGHTRLSILDLSTNGKQPMSSSNSRYTITYNGEIYNHLDLRKKINSKFADEVKWKSNCDTETLLVSIEVDGVLKTLKNIQGMFAFAVWDNKLKKLFLARDRVGEKPLYYGWVNNTFIFSSDISSFKLLNRSKNPLNYEAISSYFDYGYIPAPLTIYKDVFKLEPGKVFSVELQNIRSKTSKIEPYWELEKIILQSKNKTFEINPENNLEKKLIKSVNSQMISDVPIGVFLSGGIDSTLVASIASKNVDKLKTFTLGFSDGDFSEINDASKIAKHLKTEHHEIILDQIELNEAVFKINDIYQEPFADSSQIPTYLISKYSSKEIKVALTGDGADEVFGGYNRYVHGPALWNKLRFIPNIFKKNIFFILSKIPSNKLLFFLKLILNLKNKDKSQVNTHLKKIIDGFYFSENMDEFLYSLKINFKYKEKLLKHSKKESNVRKILKNYSKNKVLNDSTENLMLNDTLTYLPDDILTKVDRASMFNSLETRCPYLDKDLISLAWSYSLESKINNGKGKLMLKDILHKYVPKKLIDKPKQGFAMPISSFLKNSLKDWAENLIYNKKYIYDHILDFDSLNDIWKKHLNNYQDNSSELWTALVFISWLKNNN